MKPISKLFFFILLVLSIISCKDQDLTDPSLTLLGNASILVPYGNSYIDPGAKAIDNEDGDISSNIIVSGKPSGFEAGKFIINYKVSDKAKNFPPDIQRDVTISYTGLDVLGNYNVDAVCDSGTYNFSIALTDTTNDVYEVVFTNFGNIFSYPVYGIIDGRDIKVPLQYPIPNIVFSTQGVGTISILSGGIFSIDMDYKIVTDTATINCNMVATMQ